MQRRTLCLRCGFEGGNYRQFLWAVFLIFMRVLRVSPYPEEVQAGSVWLSLGSFEQVKKNNQVQLTCECSFCAWHVSTGTGHGRVVP